MEVLIANIPRMMAVIPSVSSGWFVGGARDTGRSRNGVVDFGHRHGNCFPCHDRRQFKGTFDTFIMVNNTRICLCINQKCSDHRHNRGNCPPQLSPKLPLWSRAHQMSNFEIRNHIGGMTGCLPRKRPGNEIAHLRSLDGLTLSFGDSPKDQLRALRNGTHRVYRNCTGSLHSDEGEEECQYNSKDGVSDGYIKLRLQQNAAEDDGSNKA